MRRKIIGICIINPKCGLKLNLKRSLFECIHMCVCISSLHIYLECIKYLEYRRGDEVLNKYIKVDGCKLNYKR